MSEQLTDEGYEQTKEKLHDLESRLAEIVRRTDLAPAHLASVRRSYKMMIRESPARNQSFTRPSTSSRVPRRQPDDWGRKWELRESDQLDQSNLPHVKNLVLLTRTRK